MAKPKDPLYAPDEVGEQTIPHPARFPGSDTPACVTALANGRRIQMNLADEDETDMSSYGDFARNSNYY